MLVRSLPRRATDRLCHHQVLLVCCAAFAYPTRAREPVCNPPFEARTGAPGYQADTRRGQTAATSSHHAGDTVNTEETLVPTSGRMGCCHALGSVPRGLFRVSSSRRVYGSVPSSVRSCCPHDTRRRGS